MSRRSSVALVDRDSIAAIDPAHAQVDLAPPSTRGVLVALGRSSLPRLLEATVVPTIIFWIVLVTIGAAPAMIAVFAWMVFALGRRFVRGIEIPSLMLLATVGLCARTLIGVLSGSTFAYFVQPVATALALGAVFAGSAFIGQPVIGRLAADFCHLDADVARRPAVRSLFRGLTLMWAGVHVLTALSTFGMLVTLPTATYVALKTLVSLTITVTAIIATIMWSVRIAQREQLVLAPVTR